MFSLSNKKSLAVIFAILVLLFGINLLIKKDMFGQRTISAMQVWLSGVSQLYTQIWFEEGGALKNNFAQIRTFDSIEMRDLNDREVYTSFLPTCLLLPYAVAKVFNIHPSLKFIQSFACLYHFLGTLLSALITFLLCRELALSQSKRFFYSLFTGSFYIFGYLSFGILDFGFYVDTAFLIYYLAFLLTEFEKNPTRRLIYKAPLIFLGIAHEWSFLALSVVSMILELRRKENRAGVFQVLSLHLLPLALALGLYFSYVGLFDKFEHTLHRSMRRTIVNPFTSSVYSNSFAGMWAKYYDHNPVLIFLTPIVLFWNFVESKVFKENEVYKNLFLLSFGSAFVFTILAFEHSAEHLFSGFKFFIPLIIFLPFVIDQLADKVPKLKPLIVKIVLFAALFIANFYVVILIVKSWHPENKTYSQMESIFAEKNYGFNDIFFSYNIETLMDKYNKDDLISREGDIASWDRKESEPFMHLAIKKQIYLIKSPNDILTLLDSRNIRDNAKVHLIFSKKLCRGFREKMKDRIQDYYNQLFIIDITKDDLDDPNFVDNFACEQKMFIHSFFAM